MTTSLRTAAALAAAAFALLAAPAAAERIDPSVYESDVPAGMVEHGVIAFTITGTAAEYERDKRIEYWATRERVRTRTTDARTGRLLSESFSTRSETVISSGGRTTRLPGPETEPRPGWSSAYTARLIERGALSPAGEREVAGLPGLVYASRPEGGWRSDSAESRTELVVERGTGIALSRITTQPNGAYGTFRQAEVLLHRDLQPASATSLRRFSAASKRRAVRTWTARAARRR
jgi:hypothetical protein